MTTRNATPDFRAEVVKERVNLTNTAVWDKEAEDLESGE